MMVLEASRHLPLDGTYNVRDIGGYTTRPGRRTRWRTLLRADSLHRLTAPAQAELLACGVRTIVDLRHVGEQLAAPNVFAGSSAVRYLHAPLLEDPTTRASSAPAASLSEIYRLALRTRGDQIAAIFNQLAVDDGLPALVHCTAGKDRTGIVVALLLGLVGVPNEIIAEDYALSATYLQGGYFDEARLRAEQAGISWSEYQLRLVCPAPLMLDTLAWLQAEYGGVEGYLLGVGLPAWVLDSLRERLLE
jgi:protein-tyrosine phosphatase